ncbi:MAG TPA: GNAT family N-acetyltransferase [Mycobacteriales bacterium]|jgi:RimJ/RimL family protein N-acetyltransferase|nr:GNAT family N-acetyltransferase [Mycobacteriales bacterium]
MIRRLTETDWVLLREVRLASLAESPAAFGSTYARELEFDEAEWRQRAASSGWYVAADAEEILGIVAGYHDDSSPPDQRHLVAMWVAPEARGSGVAAELVEAVVTWARGDGASEVTLGVADGNERARALYLNCGFAATGARFPLHSDPARGIDIYRRSVDPLG